MAMQRTLWGTVVSGLWVALLVAGAGGLAVYYKILPDAEHARYDWLKTIATAILTGGVFAVLLKTFQFMRLIRDELLEIFDKEDGFAVTLKRIIREAFSSPEIRTGQREASDAALASPIFTQLLSRTVEDVVYGDKFLDNRSDLSEVWRKVSKLLFRNRFPLLNDDLAERIAEFLPDKRQYYLDGYRVDLDLSDAGGDRIQAIEKTDYTICTSKADEVARVVYVAEFEKTDAANQYQFQPIHWVVDGKKVEKFPPPELVGDGESKRYRFKFEQELKGKLKYPVRRTMRKEISLTTEPVSVFEIGSMIKKLTVSIKHPPEWKVTIGTFGFVNEFSDVGSRPSEGILSLEYDGLLLKGQGFWYNIQKQRTSATHSAEQ